VQKSGRTESNISKKSQRRSGHQRNFSNADFRF